MKPTVTRVAGSLLGVVVSWLGIGLLPAQAQIVVAPNDTGTLVQQDGNTFTINGGIRAGDNLFHSFQQLGLSQGQVASFLSQPEIRNILARVTGGEASIIDGVLRVTGGNSNLYLINPAGIVFGANARLDVSAAFTATTASAIGFGEYWLRAIGQNDYAALVAPPDSFAFITRSPAAIFNGGTLVARPGQSITLVGGAVVSTGTLKAPGGTITVLGVPGQQLVRLTQSGSLLSLELPISLRNSLNILLPDPLPLSALLTGGNVGHATGVTVNNGIVRLTGSGVTIPTNPGSTVISGTIEASTSSLSAPGGKIYILGDRVGLFSANLDASGNHGGGTILIGGDYQGGRSHMPLLSPSLNASRSFVSADSTLHADAYRFGNGGRVIVWSDGATQFDGKITVRGGAQAGNGGFVEVSGRQSLTYQGRVDASARNGSPGTVLLDPVDLVIRPGPGDGSGNFADGQILAGELPQISVLLESALEDTATVANIRLEATNNIVIEDLPDDFLTIPAPSGAGVGAGAIAFVADADGDGIGQFSMNPGDTLLTSGRNVTISGAAATIGRISTLRDNNPGNSATEFLGGEQLFVGTRDRFASSPGAVDVRFPDASGNVDIRVRGDLEVQRILAGDVVLTSQSGNIRTGSISSEAAFFGPGSRVVLQAPNGSIQLQGFIRAGQTNKTSDSTITIEAARFRATNPLTAVVIESDAQGNRVQVNGVDQTTPTSLFAYPRDVDGEANDSPTRRVGTGQFILQFQDQTPLVTGTGNPLITIRLLQDTTFSIGTLDPISSSMEGVIAIGAGRAPSAIVLLRDNLFATTILEEPVVDATILEQEQSRGTSLPACDPNVIQKPVLNVSAILPDANPEQPLPRSIESGLPPCSETTSE